MTKAKRVTLADVRKAAAEFGGTIDEQSSGYCGRQFSVLVDSPRGKVWKSKQCHVIYESTVGDRAEWRSQICAEAIEAMQDGLDDCEDPECDHCHPVE